MLFKSVIVYQCSSISNQYILENQESVFTSPVDSIQSISSTFSSTARMQFENIISATQNISINESLCKHKILHQQRSYRRSSKFSKKNTNFGNNSKLRCPWEMLHPWDLCLDKTHVLRLRFNVYMNLSQDCALRSCPWISQTECKKRGNHGGGQQSALLLWNINVLYLYSTFHTQSSTMCFP